MLLGDHINVDEMDGHVACQRGEKCINILVRKLEGMRPIRVSNYKCEKNTKMDPKGIACEDVDWIRLD
jgi:hypothetical protein